MFPESSSQSLNSSASLRWANEKKKNRWPPKVDSHRVKSRTWRGGGCLLPCPGSVQELQPTEEFSHSKCDMPAFSTISYNHIGDQQEKTHFD